MSWRGVRLVNRSVAEPGRESVCWRSVAAGPLLTRAARTLLSVISLTWMATDVDTPPTAQVEQARAEAQTEIFGEATNDNYGWSVANAGDVNGDGIVDFIVGAIYNSTAANAAGKAYIYLGGVTPSTIPFVTMTGMAANDQFGVSVAGAGDVNGDGYADVIVGARLNSLNGSSAGAAFIYFGGPAMSGAPDVILLGEAADDWFGNSVAGAGDVNGDGFDDVVVGAPYNDRGGSAAGAAYVFYGGPTMDNRPDVIMVGEMHDDQFGWSVAGAGDVNGDGLSDVIVGARLHCVDKILCTGNDYARGRAYVFLGGKPMDAAPDVVMDGDAANDWFGNTVAGIGDVNGDGLDDLLATAHFYNDGVNSAAGKIYLFSGGAHLGPLPRATAVGDLKDGQLGHSIAGGDVAGTGGLADVIAGEIYSAGAGSGTGKVFILSPFCLQQGTVATSISWSSCSPFVSYNLYRGSVLSDLPTGSYGGCSASTLPGYSTLLDATLPPLGDAFFYLVTGRIPLMEGALGFNSSGALRQNRTPCP